MILVVVTFLTAVVLALGAVPNAPKNAPPPFSAASGPPPNVNQNPQQVPGQPGPIPEPGKDGEDSDDLKADGFFWGGGWGGYGGWGGWGGYGGWGRGWGGYGGWGGYRRYPYGGYGWW